MDSFEQEIKAEFLNEAAMSLQDAEQAFLKLEDSGGTETIDKIFRLAHNLKGSSKAVGFDSVGEFTHHWESLLLKIKEGQVPVTKPIINLLLACLDHVNSMITSLKANMEATFDSSALLQEMQSVTSSVSSPISSEEVALLNSVPSGEIDTDLLDFSPRPAAVIEFDQKGEVQSVGAASPAGGGRKPIASTDEAIRVSLNKLEKLIDYVGEMVILQSVLREHSDSAESSLVKKTISQLGKVGKEIQDISMSLRMLPIRPTFQKMMRIVRDTAVALNKEVHLELHGEETEVDKTVLERLGDPLVHLIRNSVDHGIEEIETRQRNGKSEFGTVRLSARQLAGKMVIEVSDDGAGIDSKKVLEKAIKKGLVKANQEVTESDIFHFIFLPGFSTKDEVTDVSGRGVGMDVVKTNIEAIGGEIIVSSNPGAGTTFKIVLPLTLAILECTVVKSGDDRYVIPSYHITESLRADSGVMRHTLLGDVLFLRGENLPVLRLRELLRSKGSPLGIDPIALVVRSGAQPFVLLVDDILGQFQIVTKPLSPELRNLRGVIGSTILGDGRPALILEVNQFASIVSRKPVQLKETRGVA